MGLTKASSRLAVCLLMSGLALTLCLGTPGRAAAQAINPQVFKKKFEDAKDKAEVVAKVRVLAAACTKSEPKEGFSKVTLELCLQVQKAEKGPAKDGEIVVVSHEINWSSKLGPPALYGRQGTLRSFPCVAGVEGDVALRWDEKRRTYAIVAGWVAVLPQGAPPTEAGKATVASDAPTK
jgi:hypothetical protein